MKKLFGHFNSFGFLKLLPLLFCFLLLACNTTDPNATGADDLNLKLYRHAALNYIVSERVGKNVLKSRFSRKIFINPLSLPMRMFQVDNVDKTVATFQIEGEESKTKCNLYIREVKQTQSLFINFIGCKSGPLIRGLTLESVSENIGWGSNSVPIKKLLPQQKK